MKILNKIKKFIIVLFFRYLLKPINYKILTYKESKEFKESHVQQLIDQIEKIENLQAKKKAHLELKKKFPTNILVLESYYSFLNNNNFNFFYELKNYIDIQLTFLRKLKLDHKFQYFIPWQVFCGSVGNTHNASTLIQAKEMGLIDNHPITFVNSTNDLITNKTLFSYFAKRIKILKGHQFSYNTLFLEKYFRSPLDLGVSPYKKSYFINEFSKNQLLQKKTIEKIDSPFFKLTEEDSKRGDRELKENFGVSSDDWYVTIHARSGNTKKDHDLESFRNSDINKYYKSIELITKAGGKVFIMGNKKMPIIKKLPGVIDYAHHVNKSDFWDVYLSANSRFYVGTDSGHMLFADYFGVPSLIADTTLITTLIGMNKCDLFLPRILKYKKNGKKVNLDEFFSSNYMAIQHNISQTLTNKGLELIENTSDDIVDAVKELMDRTDNQKQTKKNFNLGKLQKKFIEKGNQLLKKNFSISLFIFATPSEKFLEKNIDIFN